MPNNNTVADFTVWTVEQSMIPDMTQLHSHFPKVIGKSKKQGGATCTYPINALSNNLINAQGVEKEYDEEPPAADTLSNATAGFKPTLKQTRPIARPERDFEAHRLQDLGDVLPGQFSRMDQILNLVCVSLMNGGTFTAVTFDGTGAIQAMPSDAYPAKNLLTAILAIRHLGEGNPNLKLEAHMELSTATFLRGFPEFQSAAYYDSRNVFVPVDQFQANFTGVLGLDATYLHAGVTNTAQWGATASYARMYADLGIWIGWVDRSKKIWDCRPEMGWRASGPDGAIALGIALTSRAGQDLESVTAPGQFAYAKTWPAGGGVEVEFNNVRAAAVAFSPQYEAYTASYGFHVIESEIYT